MGDTADNVRQNIKFARQETGLSQADIANYVSAHTEVNLSQASLSRIEAGNRQVTVEELGAIARTLTGKMPVSLYFEPPEKFAEKQESFSIGRTLERVIDSTADQILGLYGFVDDLAVTAEAKREILSSLNPCGQELFGSLRPRIEGWAKAWRARYGDDSTIIWIPKNGEKDDGQDEQKRSD